MLRTLAALGVLLPGLALAQVTAIETSDFENGDDEIINIAECDGTRRSNFVFTWSISTSTGAFPTGQLRVSNTNTCPDASADFPNAITETLETITTATGTSDSRPAPDLVTSVGFACTTAADSSGTVSSIYVCATAQAANSPVAPLQTIVRLDTRKPTPPRVTSVSPGNQALEVSWEAASGADRYRVVATPTTGGNPVSSSETTDTSKRITGVTNGVTYDVRVIGISIGGNESDPSATPLQGTPIETDNFWLLYQKQAGAQETGGCATAGTGSLALLALVALRARRRGRRS